MHIVLGLLGSIVTILYLLEQFESMLQMMVKVISANGDLTAKQSEFVENIRSQFVPPEQDVRH